MKTPADGLQSLPQWQDAFNHPTGSSVCIEFQKNVDSCLTLPKLGLLGAIQV